MLDSQNLLHGGGGYDNSDDHYTYEYAVLPLVKYIPKDWVVWCPFDTKYSEFVKVLSKTHKVIFSSIETGENFFEYEPSEHWDCIISNPAFKGKRKFFERALDLGKPFCLLMGNQWLNDSAPQKIFIERNRQLQLLMFDKRMKFSNSQGRVNNKITFSSSYFCCDFLPKDLIQEILNIPKK